MDAYVEALRRTVTPGSLVLDVGTGAGILALVACRFGARRVYAIEPSNIVEVGREIASANQYTPIASPFFNSAPNRSNCPSASMSSCRTSAACFQR